MAQVGQNIAFCGLLPGLRWGMLELASRPEGRGFSTLSGGRTVATHDRVEKPPKWTSAVWLIPEIAERLAGI